MTKPNRVLLPHNQFEMVKEVLQGRKIYYIAGNYSMFVPSQKTKYILSTYPDGKLLVRDWTNANGELETLTPSEAARAELARAFPNIKRVGWQAQHIKLFDWRWPMLFTGPKQGNGVYIDLSGAYHQLYSRLWLDVCFPCGYGEMSLRGIAENLSDWKAARNSMIGITASREGYGVLGFKFIPLKTHNPYLSPHLWATIQAILNEIAFKAEQLEACYIATDGYIFPKRVQAERFEECLYNWGLRYKKVSGTYDIKAFGSYKVEGKKTKTYRKAHRSVGAGFRSINLFDPDYPTRLVNWWAHSIGHFAGAQWNGGRKEQWTGT